MNALLTDLYELTMAAGYFEAGKTAERAVFELTVRRLPPHRNFVLAAGLPQVVDYLLHLAFTADEIAYLRALPQFRNVSPAFFDYLRDFRFTGDLFAVPEGTPLFAGEPMLTLRAPIVEAQIPETYLLSALSFQSLIATKAARCAEVSGGRAVVEFGTRRAHTPEAGVLGARAAYLGGCAGTSNTLAGFRYGIPVMGTVAHSWVMSFCGEAESFRQVQRLLGDCRRAAYRHLRYHRRRTPRRRRPKVRSGVCASIAAISWPSPARSAKILDDAGHTTAKIMISGDLDEYRIRDLLAAGAPIDGFGVGTQLAISADAPTLSAVYKLVEIEICGIQRFTAKFSDDKPSYPGSKQVFRDTARDVIARSGECGRGEALLRPIILGGRLIEPLPTLEQARQRAAESIAKLPAALRQLEVTEPWPVIYSRELRELIERTRRNILG